MLVCQVARQDERALPQREDQHGDHRHRHDGDELTHHARHEEQRYESDDGCRYRSEHRGEHLDGAGNGRVDRALAALAMGMDVLADHDCVVDQDTQHHQDGKHREHVERLVESQQDGRSAEDRNGNTNGHPGGQSQLEEDGQYDQHQNEALKAVAGQEADPVVDHDRVVIPRRERVAVGKVVSVARRRGLATGKPRVGLLRWAFRGTGEKLFDLVDDFDQILVGRLLDRDRDARFPVDLVDRRCVDEFVTDFAQVAHRQDDAVRLGHQWNLGDFLADQPLVLPTQQNLLRVGLHAAAGHLDVLAPDDPGHLLQRQPVLAKRLLRNLDVDLVVLCADHFYL